MLKVNGIDAYYGDVCALHDISLEIGDDEIISKRRWKDHAHELHRGLGEGKKGQCGV